MTRDVIGIKEVAASAGVSIATVSRYLSGKTIRPAYRERVMVALASLDYHPNLIARRLRSGSVGLIGLVVPDISNPFFYAFNRAIETLAWREGLRVVLTNTDESCRRETRLLRMLEDEQVCGIVIAPAVNDRPPITSVPTIFVDRGFANSRRDTVLLDNAGGAAALVDTLHAAGYRRILGIFGQSGMTADERRHGFAARIAARGLPLLTATVPHETDVRQALVRKAIATTETDAVLCGDSLILLDAAIAIRKAARDDIRLSGFDSAGWQRLLRDAPIILVQPVEEMAHAALALLISRMAGEDGQPVVVTFSGRVIASPPGATDGQAKDR